jgi:hypothetical protein
MKQTKYVNLIMQKITVILFLILCLSFKTSAQNICVVSTNYTKVLCEKDTVNVSIEPKNANIFW